MTGAEPQQPETGAKKPYAAPRLTEFGSISKLTQNGTGSGTDGGRSASKSMMCL